MSHFLHLENLYLSLTCETWEGEDDLWRSTCSEWRRMKEESFVCVCVCVCTNLFVSSTQGGEIPQLPSAWNTRGKSLRLNAISWAGDRKTFCVGLYIHLPDMHHINMFSWNMLTRHNSIREHAVCLLHAPDRGFSLDSTVQEVINICRQYILILVAKILRKKKNRILHILYYIFILLLYICSWYICHLSLF